MTLILTLIFAICVNWFMLFYEPGLGLFLLCILYVGYLSYHLYKNKALSSQEVIKIVLTIAIVLPFILRDMEVFKVLTLLGLPFWFGIFYVELNVLDLMTYWKPILINVFSPLIRLHLLIKELLEKLFKGHETLKYTILGVVIVLPLLLIVVPLLIEADVMFKWMTVSFFESFEFSAESVVRFIFCTFVGSYVYAQVVGFNVKKLINSSENPLLIEGSKVVRGQQMPVPGIAIMLNTALITVNAIYCLFVYIQVRYLFLSQGKLPNGVTYAAYAREGFFQLLAVAIINVLLVGVLEIFNRRKLKVQRSLEGLTLMCTLIMAISAFYRMHLYEVSYGYTRLRLLVFMFLVFLMICIVLLLAYLVCLKKSLINGLILFSLFFYIGASWFNVDGFVVSQNIARYKMTGKFDSVYALSLSSDAIDQLTEFYANDPEAFSYEALDTHTYYSGELQTFEAYLVQLKEEKSNQPWQAYNFAIPIAKK